MEDIISADFNINLYIDYDNAVPFDEVNELIDDVMQLVMIVIQSQCKDVDYEITAWNYHFIDKKE